MDPRRHRSFEGGHNIRDLGGYETADGGNTNWGVFFRSACLDRLTHDAVKQLIDLGLQTVIDLRQPSELESSPSVFAGSTSSPTFHHVDLLIEGNPRPSWSADLPSDLRKAAEYNYWLDERQECLLRILETLAAPSALPALYTTAPPVKIAPVWFRRSCWASQASPTKPSSPTTH